MPINDNVEYRHEFSLTSTQARQRFLFTPYTHVLRSPPCLPFSRSQFSKCLAGATAHFSGGRRPALGLTHRLEQQLDQVGGRQLDEEVEEHGGGLG